MTLSSKFKFSIAKIAVKIFVVLAGYSFSFSFLANKIVPVSASTAISFSQYKVSSSEISLAYI